LWDWRTEYIPSNKKAIRFDLGDTLLFSIFIIGTAGSGKSFLTSAFANWLKLKKQEVLSINLDPGVLNLPYIPDVDIREYVSLEEGMKKYKLGPNGAQIMAMDLLATKIEEIRSDIEEFNADYALIDTPGQMELFAFRASGPYIIRELVVDPKAILYLFDATLSSHPSNYISNLFLANAVYTRFTLPTLFVLSKIDLLPKREVAKILKWSRRSDILNDTLDEVSSDTRRLMNRGLIQLFSDLDLSFSLMPISSTKEIGFINLHAALLRIFSGGEEVT